MARSSDDDRAPLFRPGVNDTSSLAGQKAATRVPKRRQQILAFLEQRGGAAIFEVAHELGVFDHQISGRFSELERDGYIKKSGQRKRKPGTECDAEVYVICRAPPSQKDLPADLGYPLSLMIDGQIFDRQELLPQESYPGFPYSRRTDTGALRQAVRVELVECGGCGRPLFLVIEGDQKKFRCNNPKCGRTWRTRLVNEPGKGQLLALVMEEF